MGETLFRPRKTLIACQIVAVYKRENVEKEGPRNLGVLIKNNLSLRGRQTTWRKGTYHVTRGVNFEAM